jgi:hypothetical protein
MEQFIGCDAHKKFSVFVAVNEKGQAGEAVRVIHDWQLYREFLSRLPPHSAIAVEATGHYSWIVDEMEQVMEVVFIDAATKQPTERLQLKLGVPLSPKQPRTPSRTRYR